MNGWSDNSEILCVEQWGRAEKKTRKRQFYPGSRSWCKYFPNSFTTIFIWKKLWNICSFALGFFNEPFNSSLNITLLALFLNWSSEVISGASSPKKMPHNVSVYYMHENKMKLKLNSNIHPNILSEIMILGENGGCGKILTQISNFHIYMGIAA